MISAVVDLNRFLQVVNAHHLLQTSNLCVASTGINFFVIDLSNGSMSPMTIYTEIVLNDLESLLGKKLDKLDLYR